MTVKVLYFASLKDHLKRAEQLVGIPSDVKNVADLKALLSKDDEAIKTAFETMPRLRVAVNQEMADADTTVKDGDEVAFFPPVTGG